MGRKVGPSDPSCLFVMSALAGWEQGPGIMIHVDVERSGPPWGHWVRERPGRLRPVEEALGKGPSRARHLDVSKPPAKEGGSPARGGGAP